MGSVTKVVTIEDGEGPSGASQYEMHYLYCNNCGSFELKNWKDPENYVELEKFQRWNVILIYLAAFSTLAGIIRFIAAGAMWWLSVSFLILLMLIALQRYLSAQVKEKGLRCDNCDTTYEYDSAFFKHLTDNPRNLSLVDSDIPESFTYKIQGKYLGPAEA